MSLTRLISAPMKLFKKEVITFLIIRRHDLEEPDTVEEQLRYIAVKPTASVSTLRQKVWHLLDLPDYCDEIIIFKFNGAEIPITSLRKGNLPHHPYTLEVFLPSNYHSSTTLYNMLTMGPSVTSNASIQHLTPSSTEHTVPLQDTKDDITPDNLGDTQTNVTKSKSQFVRRSHTTLCKDKLSLKSKKLKFFDQSETTCRYSISSTLVKAQGLKNNNEVVMTNVLLKIQSEISVLNERLSNLETGLNFLKTLENKA